MAMKLAIIFCVIAAASAAPKPCYTNCGSSGSFTHETMTAINTHGSLMAQQNTAFQQLHQSLLNQLHEAHANLDYSRPGTWKEQNAYRANDGGQVYEEHGQVDGGSAKMRYFKKNYTNSWGSGDAGAVNTNLLNTHGNLHHGTGISGGSAYHEEHHAQNVISSSSKGQAANIEDFGVQPVSTTSQVNQQNINVINDWVNQLESYITQCSERAQSGQLSNYQTYADVVQQSLDQMRQQVRDAGLWNNFLSQINSLETHLNEFKQQAQHSSNLVQTSSSWNEGSVVAGANQQSVVAPVAPSVPVGGQEYYSEEYKKSHSVKSNTHYAPVQTPVQTPVKYTANTYVQGAAGGYSSTGQQGYVGQAADYTQHQQQQTAYDHHAGYNQHSGAYNQYNDAYNQHSGAYNQHSAQVNQVHTPGKRVEEEWNASGRRTETTYPHQVVSGHSSGTEAAERLTHYGAGHSGYNQGYKQGYTHGSSSSYASGGSFSSFGATSGGLQTEAVDLGYGSGCQSQAYGSPCRRSSRVNLHG